MRSKWIVLGASVTGSSHLKASLPCQDAHAYCLVGDSTLIIAVADGLGSAAHAEIAAQIAVSAALEYASEFTPPILAQSNENVETAEGRGGNEDETPWLRLLQETFQFAHAALVAEAQKSQVEGDTPNGAAINLEEYATTLIVATLTDDCLAIGHIGDGAVVAALEDGSLILASAPQNDEYANVTYPLSMPGYLEQARFTVLPFKVKAVAVMSDGMTPVSIRSADQAPHAPFFAPLFRQMPSIKDDEGVLKACQNLADFLASAPVCARSSDDKTLVLAARRGG